MEIKRIGDNQVRCAITEQEIEEMGFNIDEIIGNTEETQKFMRVIIEKIEEQEAIDMELLSPMVRAELLQDHSMTITFGGITEEEKKSMFNKVMDMMERLSATKSAMDETREQTATADSEEDIFAEPTPFALEFDDIDKAVRMSKLFLGKDEIPQSEFYKMKDKYYLLMDLGQLSKPKLRSFAFAAVEYNNRHIATETGLSYIREHGKCIIKNDAINALMQL